MKEGSSANKSFGRSTEVRNDETGSQYLRNKNDRRKARKVLVERIRRERIERCLDQLKHILVQSVPQSHTGTNLEKADILELTVSHLEELRTSSPLHVSKGYLTCANEVDGFLQNVNCDPNVRHRMTQFLLKRQPTGSALSAMIGSTIAPNSSTEQIGDGHRLPANFFNPRSPPKQSARLKMCSGIESRSHATQSKSLVQSAAINKTSQVTCYDNRPNNVPIPFRPYSNADEIRGPIKNEPVWRPW